MNREKQSKFHRFFDRMDGIEFENYCARLLTRNGYKKVEVTGASGDQGIDIIAYKHGQSYGIQCKNYSGRVGNKAVQEAFAGCTFYALDYGVVLTNNYFTKSAVELAEETGILLWDREELLRIQKHTGWFGIISGLLLSLLVIGGIFVFIYYTQHML